MDNPNTAGFTAQGQDVVEYSNSSTTTQYRLVGKYKNGGNDKSFLMDISTSGALIASKGFTACSSGSVNFLSIAKYGTYPSETFAVCGLENSPTVGTLFYFNNSTITTTPTCTTFTCNTNPSIAWDVEFDNSGDIILPVICNYNGTDNIHGEGVIYKVTASTLASVLYALNDGTAGNSDDLTANDLRMNVTHTTDGGFAICTNRYINNYSTDWGTLYGSTTWPCSVV